MRSWQWLALILGVALIGLIALFPYTRYFVKAKVGRILGVEQISETEQRVQLSAGEWERSFVPVWRIRELRDQEPQMSSGGNAQVNWLVVLLLAGAVSVISGLVFGYRPAQFAGRRKALAEACWGFAALAVAAVGFAGIVTDLFSTWMRPVLGVACAVMLVGGIALLWRSATATPLKMEASGEKPA
jgi:hypothetical protein